MYAKQVHAAYPLHVPHEGREVAAMPETGRSYPPEFEKLPLHLASLHQQISQDRSTSLPARKPSPESPSAGLASMTAASDPGSSSQPTVPAFSADFADNPPASAATSYSPRTKTCLYKTEVCCSWKKTGKCRYGSKCQFAHGPEELRPVNRHPKYKTEICRSFAQTGECRYGRRCRFIHPDSNTSDVSQMLISPDSSVESPYHVPAPVNEAAPDESFNYTPVTDSARNLSAYLSLLNTDQGRGPGVIPYPSVPHPDQNAIYMDAVSQQQQQHDAAMALLQSSQDSIPLSSAFAPHYSPPNIHYPQPNLAYAPDVSHPYISGQPLSAFIPPGSLGASHMDHQMPLLSHNSHVGHMEPQGHMTQAPQYSPELLSLLAANQIAASSNAAVNTLPPQVTLPDHMQHQTQMPMDHMPVESQHMPRLSSGASPEEALNHLMSLGCGHSSIISNQVPGFTYGTGYTPWANSF